MRSLISKICIFDVWLSAKQPWGTVLDLYRCVDLRHICLYVLSDFYSTSDACVFIKVGFLLLSSRSIAHLAAGILFRRPEYTAEALNYLERCWDIYQAHCKVNLPPRDDKSMTCRELLWLFKVQQIHHRKYMHFSHHASRGVWITSWLMPWIWIRARKGLSNIINSFLPEHIFQDLNLLDHNLTTAKVLEIITADRLDPQNFSSCMDVEVHS